MGWTRVIGQNRVKQLLIKAIDHQRVPNAWLFTGPEGTGKDAMAIEVARALRCEHRGTGGTACGECRSCQQISALQDPSVQFVFALPSGKGEDARTDAPLLKLTDNEIEVIRDEMSRKALDPYHNISVPRATQIKISSIRQIKRDVSKSSVDGMRIVIISEAHEMREEAANAFLKTLEEPTPQTLLILTTSHPERLLPTIVSRCQEIRFDLLSDSEVVNALQSRYSVPETEAILAARLAGGSFSRAVELQNGELQEAREDVMTFLRSALRRSPIAAHAEVERLSGRTERTQLERFLSLLTFWLRDVIALRLTGTEEHVINVDQVPDMESFNSRFASIPVMPLIAAVDNAMYAIRRNAQPALVLTVLSLKLSELCFPISPEQGQLAAS